MRYTEISHGMHVLLADSRIHADIPLEKLYAMQDIYFERNAALYTLKEQEQLRDYLKVVTYKFHLVNLNLEQLWALSHSKRNQFLFVLENAIEKLEVSDDELLLISFVLEGFLFQARAFLDFYMLYICLCLKADHPVHMSTNKFFKALDKIEQDPLAEKALEVKKYFTSKVFGTSDWEGLNPNNWGDLLRSLRDKIAHKDRLYPSYESDEVLAGGVLFDWPTLRGITYDRFCQYTQNGIFSLLTDVSPILYELEWMPGPYKHGMWN